MCPQTRTLLRAFFTEMRRSILLSDGRNQIDDQRVDLAQVFATAFFRFQFTIANDDRQIANLVQQLSRHLFDRSIRPKCGEADEQIIFQTSDIRSGNHSQIPVQGTHFGFKHGHW